MNDSHASRPQLRTLPDRLRQVVLFELGGLVLMTPPFMLASGMGAGTSLSLLAMIAAIAALWNGCYCSAFDWLEARLAGRSADARPFGLRLLHACGFEGGLLALSLPVLVWWTGLGWWQALLTDLGIALAYVGYAFFFNLVYDRAFPVEASAAPGERCLQGG